MLQNCLNALTMQFGMTMLCAANPARQSAQKVAFPADVFAIQTHVCIFAIQTHVYRHICYTNTCISICHTHTYNKYLLYNVYLAACHTSKYMFFSNKHTSMCP